MLTILEFYFSSIVMSNSDSNKSFASAVINKSKRKRSETPSPAKSVSPNKSTNDPSTSPTYPLSIYNPLRFQVRKRSSKIVAKSKALNNNLPPPVFDDSLPTNVGCQTIHSQSIMSENALIEHYIEMANKERKAFNKERRDKNKILDILEKEAKVTELLSSSIKECLEICEYGLTNVQRAEAVFPRWSMPGDLSQSEINDKILLETEKNRRSIKIYQDTVQNVVSKTGRTMDKFSEIKNSMALDSPDIPAFVPIPRSSQGIRSKASLLSQILSNQSSSIATASQIESRHSTRTPLRSNTKSVKPRPAKFGSQLNKFLSKETIELENVNPTANIKIEVKNSPARFNNQTQVKPSLKRGPVSKSSAAKTVKEVNSKDIEFDKCNISQEAVKSEAISNEVNLSRIVNQSDSDWHDLELSDFSEEWLQSQEGSLAEQWKDFVNHEAPSDSEK